MSELTINNAWESLKTLPCAIILYDKKTKNCKINAKGQQLLHTQSSENLSTQQLSHLRLLSSQEQQPISIDDFFNNLIEAQSNLSLLLHTPAAIKSLQVTISHFNAQFTLISFELGNKINNEYNFDQVISKISTRLIDIQANDYNDQIDYALKAIGMVCNADRSYLFKYSPDGLALKNTNEWVNDGVTSYIDELTHLPIEHIPYFQKVITKTHLFKVNHLDELPKEAQAEKTIFSDQQIKSLMCIGLSDEKKLVGFIGCDFVAQSHRWTETDLLRLKLVGEMIVSAFKKITYQTKLEQTQQQLITANQNLSQLVNTDGLTNIANRRGLDQALNSEIQRCIRAKKPISLIMCDIDFFKDYNDHFGHQQGDKALIKVAKALKNLCKREGDLAARYGGEEFAIILPDTNSTQCYQFCEMVRKAIIQLNIAHPNSSVMNSLTLSLGFCSTLASKGLSSKTLLQNADKALYQAKNNGRNTISEFVAKK
ncbi:sensor domain-containing diguanylate cyclase [Pseudoalteromonas sp. MMG010]|uniref:GGDEF domain-containing protein n=1 Tax=Pseudoalteromonas sp. MMG010 TaxID=2822685 RepID=UPI001B39EDEB|nr:sensor domain-containing diguanylate cyclase [Pseudoalteromonas sp. MMG010]MBQ4833765.1 sensor domain-containing diguanylate cyclase [Pseudoalteromonas sp. MMG010]